MKLNHRGSYIQIFPPNDYHRITLLRFFCSCCTPVSVRMRPYTHTQATRDGRIAAALQAAEQDRARSKAHAEDADAILARQLREEDAVRNTVTAAHRTAPSNCHPHRTTRLHHSTALFRLRTIIYTHLYIQPLP